MCHALITDFLRVNFEVFAWHVSEDTDIAISAMFTASLCICFEYDN